MQCLSKYCGQVGPSEGSTIFFITCSYGKISYQDEKLLPVIQAINYFEQSMDFFSSWCLPRKQLLGFCSNLNRKNVYIENSSGLIKFLGPISAGSKIRNCKMITLGKKIVIAWRSFTTNLPDKFQN